MNQDPRSRIHPGGAEAASAHGSLWQRSLLLPGSVRPTPLAVALCGLLVALPAPAAQAREPERSFFSSVHAGSRKAWGTIGSVGRHAGDLARYELRLWPRGSRNKRERLTRAEREFYARAPQIERARWVVLNKDGKALKSMPVQTHEERAVDAQAQVRVLEKAVRWMRTHRGEVGGLRWDHTHPRLSGIRGWVSRGVWRSFSPQDRLEAHEIREYLRQRNLGDLTLEMGLLSSTVNGRAVKKTVRLIPPTH